MKMQIGTVDRTVRWNALEEGWRVRVEFEGDVDGDGSVVVSDRVQLRSELEDADRIVTLVPKPGPDAAIVEGLLAVLRDPRLSNVTARFLADELRAKGILP